MPSRTLAIALAAVITTTSHAHAQYFGRNKVQYDRFRFAILETAHFDIYYYEAERAAAELVAPMAERWYERLSTLLEHRFERRQPVILYASHGHFTQTSIVDGLREGIGGFTDHAAGRVVLPFAATLGETDHVLGHELVHAFQRDMLRERGRSLAQLPLWFTEGMAEQISVGRLDAHTQMWLRDAQEHGGLPSIAQLTDPRWFPYRYGQALWAFLESTYGPAVYRRALVSRAAGGGVGRLEAVTREKRDRLSRAWHAWVREMPKPTALDTGHRRERLIDRDHHGGRLNIGPALSPDGEHVVFLSERDGMAMDVYLARVEDGRVIRRLTSTARDAHFDSLQFLESAGAWDSAGARFALTTVRDGRPVLTVFAMPSGTETGLHVIPEVDQAFSPSWSPDGHRVVLSATRGGVSDLYIYDLDDGTLEQLTSDPVADLQPAWSPDGRTIVFVTDRFTSRPEQLTFAGSELARIDVESHAITRLGGWPGRKNIDPHWDRTGRHVYFVSDANGASNVYRIDVATAAIVPVTSVETGVSGITPLSPATSVSADGRTLVASVYSRGGVRLDRFTVGPSDVASAPVSHLPSPFVPSGRHPAVSPTSIAAEAFAPVERRPYTPTLSLVSIGQPYLSAGGGAFGSFLRAGASLSLSDVLNEHTLSSAVQVGRKLTDFAVQSAYINRHSRVNWGIVGGQVPALAGLSQSVSNTTGTGGAPVVVRQSDVLHTIHRQLSAVFSYPFSRALRLEWSVGADRVSFAHEVTTRTFSAASGEFQQEHRTRYDGRSATLFETGAALVSDTSVSGPLGPLLGQRYRLALSPSVGDIDVITTAVDYRRYWMPASPFTLAVRAQHVSRAGSGATDARLLPLVWTLRDLVRGYDVSDDLLRTRRYSAASMELRAPIPGVFRRELRYGAVPLEAFLFGDWGRFTTGVAGSDSPRTLGSAGIGTRVRVAGFVFEFAAARAFAERTGWRLALNFRPGF